MARAVGAGRGGNPVSLILPYHRVIGANGGLLGYAGGLQRKQRLLAMENPQMSIHSGRSTAVDVFWNEEERQRYGLAASHSSLVTPSI